MTEPTLFHGKEKADSHFGISSSIMMYTELFGIVRAVTKLASAKAAIRSPVLIEYSIM